MKYLTGALGFLLLLVVVIAIVLFTGAYNIAATAPHLGVTRWALNTLQERSVRARAGGLQVPEIDSAEVFGVGFEHYHEMCAVCHGAPGVERGEIGKGINPEPPDLEEEAEEWTEAELFWITKHGIRLAGMPAFGPTHDDRELWAIAAFTARLPEITPQEYARMVEELEAAADTAGAGHGGPGHEH